MNETLEKCHKDSPIISVVIPLYNVEKYMKKCIDSVINQTFRDIEIILVNDGSPDSSGLIAEEYLKKDKRIKVKHKQNGGLSSARNVGMEIAMGKYIFFVDSDDWVDTKLLEKAYQKIEETESEICVFNVLRIEEHTKKSLIQGKNMNEKIDIITYGKEKYIKEFILNSSSHRYSAWNRLYKLEFLKSNKLLFEPNNEIHSEDMLFNLECCLYVTKICSLNEALYFHLLRTGTISSSNKPNITEKLMTLCDRYINKAKNSKKYDEIEGAIPEIVQYLFFMAMGSVINSNKGKLKDVHNAINYCYNKNFFQISMRKMGNQNLSKRNLVSRILGKKLSILSSIIIFYTLKE